MVPTVLFLLSSCQLGQDWTPYPSGPLKFFAPGIWNRDLVTVIQPLGKAGMCKLRSKLWGGHISLWGQRSRRPVCRERVLLRLPVPASRAILTYSTSLFKKKIILLKKTQLLFLFLKTTVLINPSSLCLFIISPNCLFTILHLHQSCNLYAKTVLFTAVIFQIEFDISWVFKNIFVLW